MKSALTQLIAAIVICTLSLIGYGILYGVISAKSVEVGNLETQIETKTEAATRIVSARAAIAEISGDEMAVQNYFVPETSVVSFIDSLQARGRAQGTEVGVLSVSSNSGAHQTLTLSLTVKGSFDALMRTIGTIEYAPYALSISSLTVAQDSKNAWHAALIVVVGSIPQTAATSTPSVPVVVPTTIKTTPVATSTTKTTKTSGHPQPQ